MEKLPLEFDLPKNIHSQTAYWTGKVEQDVDCKVNSTLLTEKPYRFMSNNHFCLKIGEVGQRQKRQLL